jgi:hypothetical protein
VANYVQARAEAAPHRTVGSSEAHRVPPFFEAVQLATFCMAWWRDSAGKLVITNALAQTVLISHSGTDSARAAAVADLLTTSGIEVRLDRKEFCLGRAFYHS